MRVGVGSGNPVKLVATESALPDLGTTVESVAVESGVPEQPWGDAETVRGARTRARRALAGGDYDLGVGIEGGVARVDATGGLFLVVWAAATDGDETWSGAGPRVHLPASVAERLEAGDELGPVMDDLTGQDGIKHDRGAAGVLTGGAIDREAALAGAVAGALGPFVTGYYEDGGSSTGVEADSDVALTPATPADLDRVESLLDEAGLPTADVRDGSAAFYVVRDSRRADDADEVVGVGGLEVYGRDAGGQVALLRSVAVAESARGRGYGTAIARRLTGVARSLCVRECYLLTTDADGFFARLGFESVERDAVPAAIRGTTQFADLCPETATAMRRTLG